MTNQLALAYPRLAERVPNISLADLPTPLIERTLSSRHGLRQIAVKCDDVSAVPYGGNKVRKLEYLLYRARERGAKRIATFGAVASNHAIATALFSRQLGFDCTCFLLHQTRTAGAAKALEVHVQNGTEIIRWGSSPAECRRLLREHLWHRKVWLIPIGGSSWLGAVGFVNAGLELAEQLAASNAAPPDRLYVANGTMATAVGVALGLDFLGDGYAKSVPAIERAVAVSRDELGLELETTYTGKAMAALLHDLEQRQYAGQSVLFWNTRNSQPLPVTGKRPRDTTGLPREFLRYFEET